MAWSAVASAVTTIGKLLAQEAVYLWGVEEQVDRLQTELKWMQSSLMDADVKQHEDERIRLWVAEIRELAYDAEDVIEDFALRVGSKRKGGVSGCIKRSSCILREGWDLHQTRSKIEEIIEKILDLVRRLQVYNVKGLRDEKGSTSLSVRWELRRPYPHIIDQNTVGVAIKDGIEKLVPKLVEEGTHTHCRVISIWGMGGLGKTTLAKKIYHDCRVTSHFNHLALVFVSQQFQTRRVWEDILSGFKKLDANLKDEELASKLFNLLRDKKCLVILDDIWNKEAWDRLKPAFPAETDRSSSRILLTTRKEEIVSYADRSGYKHNLPFLSPEESWELFQKIAFPPSDSTDVAASSKVGTPMEECSAKISNECASEDVGISEQEVSPVKDMPMDVQAESGAENSDKPMLRGECSENALAKDVTEDKKQKSVTEAAKGDAVLMQEQENNKKKTKTDDSVDDKRKKKLGEAMLKQCAGLPLAIVVLGGILATKSSLDEWQRMSVNVKSYLNRSRGQGTMEVLALSYDDLPAYLRPCFLYLSHFPEDYKIEAQRLIQLWIAEGIVSSKEEGEVAEDVAEQYLMELAGRCMILVQETDVITLKIITVKLHDEMRRLCLSQAKKENFVFIVDESNASSLSIIRKVRRVSMHESVGTQYIECPNLRSLSFFTTSNLEDLFEGGTLSASEISPFSRLSCFWYTSAAYIFFLKARGFWVHIFTNLKFLRVLNCEGLYGYAGCKLMGDIENLIHLRFLSLGSLRFTGTKLPSCLGNLICLQTLDLRLEGMNYIHVPDVIWRMEQLRHLYLPHHCDDKTKLKLATLRNLQTLVNFSTKYCYLKDLINMKNLRELEICGIFEIEDFNGENLGNNPRIIQSKYLHTLSISSGVEIDVRHLNHLLSSCASICRLSLVGNIITLPEFRYLFSNLSYIHLNGCPLEEDPMPTLEKLPNLRLLVLFDDSFLRKEMCCSAQGFPKLESLFFYFLRHLERWKVHEGAMPCLRRLEIVGCNRLEMLPNGLRFITTLQELKIVSWEKELKDRVVKGGPDFDKVQHVPSVILQEDY